ncbi:MAG: ribonuclease P protein component [Acidobacteriota bacterium]
MSGGARDERLLPSERVRKSVDYRLCYREGRRRRGRLLTLHHRPNREGVARIGITASRKVGKAVVRQRLKRQIREIYRRWPERPRLPAVDLVVHLHPAAARSEFAELQAALLAALAAVLNMTPDTP